MQDEWKSAPAPNDLPSKFKRFSSNHEKEYVSCFTNLNRIIRLLNAGFKLQTVINQCSFFRSEGNGLFRIGQSGVKAAKETRLYVYPDEEEKTIHILSIGTKETQQNDIISAKSAIKEIRKIKK
jgi:hypothetical protein